MDSSTDVQNLTYMQGYYFSCTSHTFQDSECLSIWLCSEE